MADETTRPALPAREARLRKGRLELWRGRQEAARARAQASVDRALASAERDAAAQLRAESGAHRAEAVGLREQALRLRADASLIRQGAMQLRDAANPIREEAAQLRVSALKARAESSGTEDVAAHRQATELAHKAMLKSQEATARDREAATRDREAAEQDRQAAEQEALATSREREASEAERRAAVMESGAAQRDRTAADSEREAAEAEARAGEERVRASDVMGSLRTLAGGIAHQINDPLSAVLANLTFARGELGKLADQLPGDGLGQALHAMQEAVAGAEHIRDTVRAVKSWAGDEGDDGKRLPIPPARILDGAVQRTGEELRRKARLLRADGEVPPVAGSEPQLVQVVTHLLTNAMQALPDGEPDRHEVRLSTSLNAPLGMAVIEVSDTGSGIAAEVLPRIFDPFFTTREVGRGAGLGLSICQGIVHAHGGEITVESEVGRGSTFQVLLPIAVPQRGQEPAEERPPEPRGRVLVVDDDQRVAESMARLLALDHEVSIALAGKPALDLLVAAPDDFDVVLCDLKMPSMSGIELYGELAKVDPDLARRLVFITGGALPETTQEFLRERGLLLLEKPVDVGALGALIRKRVNARRSGPMPPNGAHA